MIPVLAGDTPEQFANKIVAGLMANTDLLEAAHASMLYDGTVWYAVITRFVPAETDGDFNVSTVPGTTATTITAGDFGAGAVPFAGTAASYLGQDAIVTREAEADIIRFVNVRRSPVLWQPATTGLYFDADTEEWVVGQPMYA